MLIPFTNSAKARSERGVYLIVIAGALIGILALVAFSIDMANIYWTRREAQAIADVTALAGVKMLQIQPPIPVSTVAPHVRNLARYNLSLLNFPQAEINRVLGSDEASTPAQSFDTYTLDTAPDRKTVTFALFPRQELLLLGRIPGFSLPTWGVTIHAAAKAAIGAPRQIVIVLDVSRSMDDVVSNQLPQCVSGDNNTKLCAAKQAAKNFIARLGSTDQVAIVSFSSSYPDDSERTGAPHPNWNVRLANFLNDARVEYPCADYSPLPAPGPPSSCPGSQFVVLGDTTSAERANVNATIDRLTYWYASLTNGGATNIGAGLFKANQIMQTVSGSKAVVLLTDGAPTSLYASSGPLAAKDEPGNPHSFSCDRTGDLTINDQDAAELGYPRPPVSSDCSATEYADNECYTEKVCQSDGGNGKHCDELLDDKWYPIGVVAREQEAFRRLRFTDAIIASDIARSVGVHVYTIGFGNRDWNVLRSVINTSPQRYSPFQSGGFQENDLIKSIFLARVANDQGKLLDPTTFDPDNPGALLPVPPPADPTYYWDFPCMPGGAQLASQPEGLFVYATADGVELDLRFNQVSDDIDMRLVQ